MNYKNPKNIFQEKINSIIRKESTNAGLLEHIFKLQQIQSLERVASATQDNEPDKNYWTLLLEVYNLLGPSKFAELVSILKGKTITMPTEGEYQDSLVTALCYYYRVVVNLTWEETKDRLELPGLNTMKYGIKVKALAGFIDSGIMSRVRKEI